MRTPSVLFVDDTMSLASSYSDLIETQLGATVSKAVSADDAILALREEHFDVLVVDLKLDGGSSSDFAGFEVVAESLRLDYFRPVIVITGFGSIANAKIAFQQGVFDFIEKTVQMHESLLESVSKALRVRGEAFLRVSNPFSPFSSPAAGLFCGREREFKFLEERMQRAARGAGGEHFVVSGPTGVGKTSLFREFKTRCLAREFAVALVPVIPHDKDAEPLTLLQNLLETVVRALPFPQGIFVELSGYLDSVGLKLFGAEINFHRPNERAKLPANLILHDTLVKLSADVGKRAKMLLVLIDDAEHILSAPRFMQMLQHTLQMETIRNCRMLFGFSVNDLAWRSYVADSNGSMVARHLGYHFTLKNMDRPECMTLLRRLLYHSAVAFSEELEEKIYNWSSGNLKRLHIICYHLFNNQFNRRVDVDIWPKVLELTEIDLKNMGTDFNTPA